MCGRVGVICTMHQIVLEHITTEEAVSFVLAQPSCPLSSSFLTAATITPQHLMYNRSHLFEGGRLHPHRYCLPVLKVIKEIAAPSCELLSLA